MSVNINTVNALYGNNGNDQWAPRKTQPYTCLSGKVIQIRRPGPELTLRAGRVIRTFTQAIQREAVAAKQEAINKGVTDVGFDVLDKLSDEELAAVVVFARELVCSMVVSPKLVLNPNPDLDEVGPDDIGNDFWPLFNYGMTAFLGFKVPVGEGEVEVSDLVNFRGEPGIQGDSVDSSDVRAETEQSS
jgi:hypothetical protein